MIRKIIIILTALLVLACNNHEVKPNVDSLEVKYSTMKDGVGLRYNFYVEYVDDKHVKIATIEFSPEQNKDIEVALLLEKAKDGKYIVKENILVFYTEGTLINQYFFDGGESTHEYFVDTLHEAQVNMSSYKLSGDNYATIINVFPLFYYHLVIYHDVDMNVQAIYVEGGGKKLVESTVHKPIADKERLLRENPRYQKFQQDSIRYVESLHLNVIYD